MGLLKDLYSPRFYNELSNTMKTVHPSFNKSAFIKQIFAEGFSTMELKARMRHTSEVIHQFLPPDYKTTVSILLKLINQYKKEGLTNGGLEHMFIPDYIEVYGVDHFELSMKAFETVTQFISCEFAVRPFFIKYGDGMVNQMKIWSKNKNYKVRRLSSEGSRPRLPWAMAIPALKKDPSPILPILENLKNDPSDSVRRSVANNINDIAKDHPDIVMKLARNWKGISKETDAIIKHGSRTLLKKGHSDILSHFGLNSKNILVSDFKIETPVVKTGGHLSFSFRITNKNEREQTVRLEYGLYYNKSNNQLAKKVFKISEKKYEAGAEVEVFRNQSFRKITTRVFYPGKHLLSVIVNGEEKQTRDFTLKG